MARRLLSGEARRNTKVFHFELAGSDRQRRGPKKFGQALICLEIRIEVLEMTKVARITTYGRKKDCNLMSRTDGGTLERKTCQNLYESMFFGGSI